MLILSKKLWFFTKDFNTNFKNQILNFGSKLKEVNEKMDTLSNRINIIEDKSKEIENGRKISQSNALKEYLKNSTKEIVSSYKNVIQQEVGKLRGTSEISQLAKKAKVEEKQKKEEETEKKVETSKEESNENDNEDNNSQSKTSLKETVKPSTFANEDDFDESSMHTDSSPTQENKPSEETPQHEAIDYNNF